MHLLYLDDSGSAGNLSEEYLVLGGVSVYEAQVDFITTELDKLAQTLGVANPQDVEFHASEIFSRRIAPWKGLSKAEAQGVIKAVLKVFAESYDTARAFACAVHKPSFPGRDPMALAFEDLCSRFDLYLMRLRNSGDRQRGILILDESAHETSLQAMARKFRSLGTTWGVIRNLAETLYSSTRRLLASSSLRTTSLTRSFVVTSTVTLNTSMSSHPVSIPPTGSFTAWFIDRISTPAACAWPVYGSAD